MNILITGGTGYIGKNLANTLLTKGNKVFLLKRKFSYYVQVLILFEI